jgi:hypothetical protein
MVLSRFRLRAISLVSAVGLACLVALSANAGAEDVQNPAAAASPPAPVPPAPAVEPLNPSVELLKTLPHVPSVAAKDGVVSWQDGDKVAYPIVEVANDKEGTPIVETEVGKVRITRKLMEDNRIDVLDQLPQLIAQAKAAGLKANDLVLRIGILTGVQLYWPGGLVLTEGVVRKAEIAQPNRSEEKERLVKAISALIADFPHTELDDLGKKCLADVLPRLAKDEGHQGVDEVAPSLARRITRFGWLRQFFPKGDAGDINVIEQLVAKGEQHQPVVLYEGNHLRLSEVKDAFGRDAWLLVTPTRCAYLVDHQDPLYYWAWPESKPKVVVDLPVGSDPNLVATDPLGAHLYVGQEEIAQWSKDKPLVVNKDAWRRVVPAKDHKGIDTNAVTDFLPPHILITALNGDIVKLVTSGGVLTPPANGGAVECERFLADAAKVLPDPANLDLIGEYILQYCYDSPDSRFPEMLGNKNVKGDIHQTAPQTIATTCGGMFRGDCDDLAELYQTIAERQGRTAHVISLPSHAAMAFAEKKEDGNWHTYVLQTGPPIEFTDAKLPVALEKAYKSFDEGSAFDPNSLGLLLRFSGENTRSAWRLSWRIFSDPEYAKTMIDVQRDWQYQTYQRGINTMKKMIADGDQDNANFRELAGLFSYTGQFPLAVQYSEEAIKRTENAENRLDLSVEMVQSLFDAKQGGRARATALDILDHQLPALKKNVELKAKIEATQASIGIDLATALCHGKAYDLALRTLKDTQLDDVAAKIEQVGTWLGSPRYNQRTWENSQQIQQLRRQMQMFVAIGIELLRGYQDSAPNEIQKNADLQTIARAVQDWLTLVGFHDSEEPEEVLTRYATAGAYYSAMLGAERLQAMLDAVALPKEADYEHAKRIGGLAQLQLDLPWIKLSVPFWSDRLFELFDKDNATLDRAQVAKLGGLVASALASGVKLGIEHPSFNHLAHLAALVTALVGHDHTTLRERLHFVKLKDDKRLRDDTAQWLGDTARFLDAAWYSQVLQIWTEELNYKPKYFLIAWRAALTGAPQQALMVARLAAQQFKDDPSFTEEYDFMRGLYPDAAKEAAKEAAKAAAAPAKSVAPAQP